MATPVRLSLAPALVALRLLGLLARPRAMVLCKLQLSLHTEWKCTSGQRWHLHCSCTGGTATAIVLCKLHRRLHAEWKCASGQRWHLHCSCTGGTAATGASCTFEGNSIVQVATQTSRSMERHVRPTRAPAPGAQQLLVLLARPLTIVFKRGTTQASH